MLATLLPMALAVCIGHPVELDSEVGRRGLPFLPPDLARQVVRHEREFSRGAAAAATWPAALHEADRPDGVASVVAWHCRRLSEGIRGRLPFSEVVAGLGTLAHLAVDLNRPLSGREGGGSYARAFATYTLSAQRRIPVVFYGQDGWLISGGADAFAGFLAARRRDMQPLTSIVLEDLDRIGGPGAWRRLDDRSSTFGAASLLLNHAASDYVNLASWAWRAAGGLVPGIAMHDRPVIVWKGETKPREKSRPPVRFRKARR